MSKICLVTGATGMIGTVLIESLLQKNYTVRIVSRGSEHPNLQVYSNRIEWVQGDLSDVQVCTRAIKNVQYIYHCASYRKNIVLHTTQAIDVCLKNIELSTSLIRVLTDSKVERITIFSTGNIMNHSINRDDGYTYGKSICESLWQLAAHHLGIPLLIIRPSSVYGEYDEFSEQGNVVPSLITKAVHATNSIEVWGTGNNTRTLVYIHDLIRAIMLLESNNIIGVQYICNPQLYSIAEIASTIIRAVNPSLTIVFNTNKPNGYLYVVPEIHPVLLAMPWTSLEQGIRNTVVQKFGNKIAM